MRSGKWCLVSALLVLGTAVSAYADLEKVTVGGELRIRGHWWRNSFNNPAQAAMVRPEIRWPGWALRGRAIGDYLGGQNAVSFWDWDDRGKDYKLIEERTLLTVDADFSQDIRGHIALESYDIWGEDFRSNYLTGADGRAVSNDDVEIYEAYMEASAIGGTPVRLRVGRQELLFGDGWLLGNNAHHPEFNGLSYDAIRATYAVEDWALDAFYAKLAERSAVEGDGDIDLYGIYGSYKGIENLTLDAYWVWVRDARSVNDTRLGWLGETIEEWRGLDDYETTNLHTLALHAAGTFDAFDFAADAAYQFGDAGQVGALFKPVVYGDSDADFSAWAAAVEFGYTFDVAWQPRVFLGGAYFDGEDNRDLSFGEWLNPWNKPEASVSFNRLFSDASYSVFIDEMGELANFWTLRAGVTAHPTECVDAGLTVAYLAAVETFDVPVHWRVGDVRLLWAPGLTFLTDDTDADLGIETGLWARYRYSEDLIFEAGWNHLFTGDGLSDGNYCDYNGLLFNGGVRDDDADYFYIESRIQF